MIREKFASSSDPGKSYEAIVQGDGKLSCNCRGWIIKKLGKVRSCSHVERVIAKHRLQTQSRGDYRYAVGASSPQLTLISSQPAVAVASRPTPPAAITVPRLVAVPPAPTPAATFDVPAPMLASPLPAGQTLAGFCSSSQASDWVMEEKYDGHRIVVRVVNGQARGWARPRSGRTAGIERQLPAQIREGFANFPNGVYDGELLIPGMHSYDVVNGAFAGQEVYVIFDILQLLSQPTVHESYDRRRSYLDMIFSKVDAGAIRLAQVFTPSVGAVQAIWDRGGEGAILKRKAAIYQPGYRSRDFVKVKAVSSAVLTMIGYEVGKSGPHSTVRLEGTDGSSTTVKTKDNDALRAFAADPTSFIGRKLRIEFQERTPDGSYRHPRWDRWENE